jgi:hypothetical protein
MKKITVLAVILLLAVAVTPAFSQTKAASGSGDAVVTLTPDNFQDKAVDMVGKEVEIQGMVVHVCKHGGKKMFLVGENPDMRVKITASDKVSVFDPELEGSIVNVTGIVEPMDDAETVAAEAASEGNKEDADHKNYYHKPQFSISCMKMKEIKD